MRGFSTSMKRALPWLMVVLCAWPSLLYAHATPPSYNGVSHVRNHQNHQLFKDKQPSHLFLPYSLGGPAPAGDWQSVGQGHYQANRMNAVLAKRSMDDMDDYAYLLATFQRAVDAIPLLVNLIMVLVGIWLKRLLTIVSSL